MSTSNKGNKINSKINMAKVPVIVAGGITAFVNPNTIPEDKWDHHHGQTASGAKVNSLQSTEVGESLIIRTETGGPSLSVSKNEFEVAAVQILSKMGYRMQPPTGN